MAWLKGFALLAEKHSAECRQKVARGGMAQADEMLQLARIVECKCALGHDGIDPEQALTRVRVPEQNFRGAESP